jgi:hypothetical protein
MEGSTTHATQSFSASVSFPLIDEAAKNPLIIFGVKSAQAGISVSASLGGSYK